MSATQKALGLCSEQGEKKHVGGPAVCSTTVETGRAERATPTIHCTFSPLCARRRIARACSSIGVKSHHLERGALVVTVRAFFSNSPEHSKFLLEPMLRHVSTSALLHHLESPRHLFVSSSAGIITRRRLETSANTVPHSS